MSEKTEPGGRRFDSLAQEAYLRLWRAYDRLKAVEDEFFAGWGLTAQQYNLLRLVQAADPRPVSATELAGRLVSRAPDVSRMLDKLADGGLLVRERSAGDRRAVAVTLTAAGAERLNEIVGPLADCHRRQLGHLNESQLAAMSELLRAAGRPHEPETSPWV